MQNYILLFITLISTVSWQLVLKLWQNTLYFPKELSFSEILIFIEKSIFNIYFLISVLLTFIWAITWILVIQKMKLSIAYPSMSLSYVLVFLASYYIFKENISLYQILWLFFIIIWVSFISIK
jgi:multidrug transporter EmrE-like cation transporter